MQYRNKNIKLFRKDDSGNYNYQKNNNNDYVVCVCVWLDIHSFIALHDMNV